MAAALTFPWLTLQCSRYWQPIQQLSFPKSDELIEGIGFLVIVIYNKH